MTKQSRVEYDSAALYYTRLLAIPIKEDRARRATFWKDKAAREIYDSSLVLACLASVRSMLYMRKGWPEGTHTHTPTHITPHADVYPRSSSGATRREYLWPPEPSFGAIHQRACGGARASKRARERKPRGRSILGKILRDTIPGPPLRGVSSARGIRREKKARGQERAGGYS